MARTDPEVTAREQVTRVPEVVEVEVGPVAHGGHCVARLDGQVVFVRHALPGERVRIRVTDGQEGDRFLRADAVEVLEPSPHRVPAPCRYARPGGCGGCDFQHADLPYQRELKTAVVREQLARLAKLDLDEGFAVEPLPPPTGVDDGLRWRTRVEFAVQPAASATSADPADLADPSDATGLGARPARAGLRRHRSHDIVEIDDCLIADQRILASGVLDTSWTGCTGVDAVAADEPADAVLVPLPERRGQKVPHVVQRVATPTWSAELTVGARGFWQVHPAAASTFVAHVLAELDPQPGDRALDLYAGVGLFALALADAVGETGAVLAVEAYPPAVEDARRNAKGLPQVELRTARVDRALKPLLRQGIRADLVVLDPPRTGAGKGVVTDIAALEPRAIAYVACDPAALARDTAYLAGHGYRLTRLRAFDAFPMTHHVECLATFAPDAT